MPLVMRLQLSPPSVLRRTPSTSTPAQTTFGSDGSTVSAVTRGTPTFGHSSTISTGSFCQLRPPSVERNSPAGRVPAKIMSGLVGSIAMRQTSIAFIGESSRAKLWPPSRLL